MKLSAFVRGLEILRPHFKDADGFHIGAEHDQFYVYMTDTPLNESELAEMKELGWFQPEVKDNAPYDPEEGWSAFT